MFQHDDKNAHFKCAVKRSRVAQWSWLNTNPCAFAFEWH